MSERNGLDEIEIGVRLPSGGFTRNMYMPISDIPKMRKRYKNKGVYVSAYSYLDGKDKSEKMLLYGHLYIDLDHPAMKDNATAKDAFEELRADAVKAISFLSAIMGIDEEMIKIYYSGQKGLHIVVPAKVIGITPMPELNHVFKLVALEIHKMSKYKTVDTGIYDNARLFSLPGSRHPVTGRYKIPLSFHELRTLSFDNIKKLSRTKRKGIKYKEARYSTKANRMFQTYIADWEKQKKEKSNKDKKGYEKKLNFCPPCVESILNRECPDGFRNNTAAALASYYKQRGYSKKKGWNEIKEWNSQYANLPLHELETTFESIYNGSYVYGCSRLAELGDCQRNNCKIGIQKDKKK